nr:immunoglobulin heavy chain junction region [Macaca mulatta]MOX92771.1 immunoglobulin heavy chain junction region [Macaca mulatta]MOX92774.1 immunoglobulin heavy chain junction region [Macaca mulatta]MOX93410.1 immunoglobulin heavy chain junction region [Macaca mulatta]MOX94301.1 immunoglobulin heavy chain junction region [Macaca mulatta]
CTRGGETVGSVEAYYGLDSW